VQLVDLAGKFTSEVLPWAGKDAKGSDPDIRRQLKADGKLFKIERIEHEYPFCWRCDTPLLYYAKDSWFIRTTAFKDQMIANNQQITWYPDHIKNGRFGNWLEERQGLGSVGVRDTGEHPCPSGCVTPAGTSMLLVQLRSSTQWR